MRSVDDEGGRNRRGKIILRLADAVGRTHVTVMRFRLLAALLVLSLSTGCLPDKKDKTKKPKDTTKDESKDVAFQSFTGRLLVAVERRDKAMLSSLMAPDFGYRWDTPPAGEDVFMYWDRNNLWGQLSQLMRTQWVPHGGFMVVPPQLAADDNYAGFRAGLRMINGSWRFCYFVPAPPAEPEAPPSPAPTSL